MSTLGIDLAAQPRATGACTIEWDGGGRAFARLAVGLLDDDALVSMAADADVVGIDVPLGWPDAFVAAVGAFHAGGSWPDGLAGTAGRVPLRYRRTDLHVMAAGARPLSVASDLIAVCAFRGAGLQARLGMPARDGSEGLVEVYPAGALRVWGLPATRYKGSRGAAARAVIVESLLGSCPWLAMSDDDVARCRRRDHDLDALVAALVARAAAQGQTSLPADAADVDAARREGWIHLPNVALAGLGTVGTMATETPLSVHRPTGEPKGGVVVIQEAFGVNDHIEDVCRRFAEEGWLAAAPHLFHRSGDPKLPYDIEQARPHMGRLTSDGVLADVDAALDELDRAGIPPERRGIVGFCMGGSVALVAGAHRDLGAAVTFYGGGVKEGRFGFRPLVEEAADLRVPWLGLFGDQDHGIPVDQVEELREAAAGSKQETEVVRYPDAGHGFHCDQRDSYHPASSADAWRRTLEWFDRHLAA